MKHTHALSPRQGAALVLATLCGSLTVVAGTTSPSAAGPAASGQFLVNTETFYHQTDSDIAMAADGTFVVTWSSEYQDGSGRGVYAQRYDAAGVARGLETRVNTTVAGDQGAPTVAMDADGDYVIAWESADASNGYNIYSQRYDASGAPRGAETRVNATLFNDQRTPDVAMEANGDYAIVWASNFQGDPEGGTGYDVYVRRYDAGGNPLSGETMVNSSTVADQFQPSVAMDAVGGYVVTWSSIAQDGNGLGIFLRRFTRYGVAMGIAETRVNTTTNLDQADSSIAMAADGSFVVTWTSTSQDGLLGGIYAQLHDGGGNRRGVETRVNTTTLGDQYSSSAAMDATGDYAVTWVGEDNSAEGVFVQRYRADGTPLAPQGQVNIASDSTQYKPAVAMDGDGDLVVSWSTLDAIGFGIGARRFRGADPVDLRLTQTDNRDPAQVNGTVTYRTRVANLNEASSETEFTKIDGALGSATGIHVVSTVPDDAALAAYAGTGWSCTSSAVTTRCSYGAPLAAGEVSPILDLTYQLGASARPALHTARVHLNQFDPVTANDSETERTAVECAFEFNSPAYSVAEAGGSATIVVARRGSSCGAGAVDVVSGSASATPDLDYGVVNETLVFAESDTSRSFTVPIVADALDEKAEQVKLRLADPTDGLLGTRRAVNLTIVDDDLPPRINFVTTSGAGSEPGAVVEAALRLSEVSGQPVSVTLAPTGTATAGTDYFAPTRIVIPAGQRAVSFDLEVVDDAVVEGVENARLTIAAPVAATLGSVRAFVLTITSND